MPVEAPDGRLAAAGLSPVALGRLPDGAEILSSHARRFTARIPLDGPAGPTAVYVKWWAAPRARDLLTGRAWRDPARREAAALARLRAAGVRVPDVLECRRAGAFPFPGECRLVLDSLPGCPLTDGIPTGPAERRALARSLGSLLATLARAGLGHPDLHAGHVVVDGPPEAPRPGVVDAARARLTADPTDTLAALWATRPAGATRADGLRAFRAANGPVRRDTARRTRLAAVLARAAALAPRLRARAVAPIVPEIVMDGGRLLADDTAVASLLAHGFTTAGAFTDPARGTLVRTRDGRENVQWHLHGEGAPVRWFGKRHHRRPWFESWRAVLGLAPPGDPAFREWDAMRRLRALGIPAAPPVAYGPPGFGGPSFVVCAEVPGGRPLDDVLRNLRGRPAREARARRLVLAARLAALVRPFHDVGYTHRDLYACHVLVSEGLSGPVLTLIDLGRVERGAPFAHHRLVKDLAALEYSTRGLVPRTERLRWMRTYRGELTAEARALARAASRKADRIAAHDGGAVPR